MVIPTTPRFVTLVIWCDKSRHVERIETLLDTSEIPFSSELSPTGFGRDVASRNRNVRFLVGAAVVEVGLVPNTDCIKVPRSDLARTSATKAGCRTLALFKGADFDS